MKLLDVYFEGFGQRWKFGRLAENRQQVLFEYTDEALERQIEMSPLRLPLRRDALGDFPDFQYRLPGVIADSLPDGWGLMLMDRFFRRKGRGSPAALERLAFVGDRAIGAFAYEPSDEPEGTLPNWSLKELAAEVEIVVNDEAGAALDVLAQLGGSPQGARPKALVQFNAVTGRMSTQPDASGAPWLVKFPAGGEHREVCAIEHLYMRMAGQCGIETPETRVFEIGRSSAAFGIERFDRRDGQRIPVASLAALLDANFRVPGSVDYLTYLRMVRLLTRDQREVEQAFARLVFNVVFHNRDDHPKNFAFRMDEAMAWKLAPVFDLTFSDGPSGQHHMDVMGKGESIARNDLVEIAKAVDIRPRAANEVIDRSMEVANRFVLVAAELPIRGATVDAISQRLKEIRAPLER